MAKFAIDMKVDVEMLMERYGLEEDEVVECLEAFVEDCEGEGLISILEAANVFDT